MTSRISLYKLVAVEAISPIRYRPHARFILVRIKIFYDIHNLPVKRHGIVVLSPVAEWSGGSMVTLLQANSAAQQTNESAVLKRSSEVDYFGLYRLFGQSQRNDRRKE